MAGLSERANAVSSDVQFVASRPHMALMACHWMLAGGIFALLAIAPLPGRQHDWLLDAILAAIGYPGIVMSAVFAVGWIRNLLHLDGVVLSIGPLGIVDRRVSEQLLPWSAVEEVQGGSNPRGPTVFLRLRVDPKFDSTWPKYFDAKLPSLIVRLFDRSAAVHLMSAFGLKASFGDVEDAIMQYRFFQRW